MMQEAGAFFDGKPEEQSLWQTLQQRCEELLDPFEVRVGKTQLSLYSGCMFGCISHPRSRRMQGIVVTFGLPFRADSPRIAQSTEPYPGRWTHHVNVSSANEIDEELISWLAAAQNFAKQAAVRRRRVAPAADSQTAASGSEVSLPKQKKR